MVETCPCGRYSLTRFQSVSSPYKARMGRSLPEAIKALDFCAHAIREHLKP